jgi:hypothetical protein
MFRSVLHKLRTGGRIRHTVSRSDLARYRQMELFAAENVAAAALSITDCVRNTDTLPSRFYTDSMIAAWLSREDLQQRFQQLDEEICQYAFLIWYLCVRPIEDGLVLSCEPTGPILTAMSKAIVAEEPESGAPCTALMLASYCYVVNDNGDLASALPRCRAKDIVAWFFCGAAYYLRVSHTISQTVRIDLAAPRPAGVSPMLKWAVERMPDFAGGSVAKERGLGGVLECLDTHYTEPATARWRDLLRESLIVDGQARFDDPPRAALPAVCRRLGDIVRDRAEFELTDGQPEYMCIGGYGGRLLVREEWYPAELVFTWSRAPISTVLFYVPGGMVEWLRIGMMFDRAPLHERCMRILLNHNCLWKGTISDVSSDELILACTSRCLAYDVPNLLQVEVEEAFVPAEHSLSPDNRRLGIGLKRLWIQRAEGLV